MSFYSSNQQKQRAYIKDRKIKEEVEMDQQDLLDEILDKEQGLDNYATNLSQLSKRVGRKLYSSRVNDPGLNGDKILTDAINNNNLTNLFNKIKKLDDSKLNSKQKLMRDDLKDVNNKAIINELIMEALPDGIDAIKQTVIESVGGVNGNNDVLDMIAKAVSEGVEDLIKPQFYKADLSKGRQIMEGKKMKVEDTNIEDEDGNKKINQVNKFMKSTMKTRMKGENLLKEASLEKRDQIRRNLINQAKKQFRNANDRINQYKLPMEKYYPF